MPDKDAKPLNIVNLNANSKPSSPMCGTNEAWGHYEMAVALCQALAHEGGLMELHLSADGIAMQIGAERFVFTEQHTDPECNAIAFEAFLESAGNLAGYLEDA